MKKLLLFISCFFIFLNSNTNAQSFEWAKKVEGNVTSKSICTDNSGNVYVIGDFKDTALFETVELIAAGYNDIFIAKYDSDGNLLWVNQAGASSNQGGTYLEEGNSIVADNLGNCYVTGSFRNDATFGTTFLTSAGILDIFIAKYNGTGDLIWAKRAGGVDYDWVRGIALDKMGHIYITGYFVGPANFGLINLNGNGTYGEIFIAKYDTTGNVIWARQAGGQYTDYPNGISIDNDGNSYIAGTFNGYAYFGPFLVGGIGTNDGFFLAKYNDDGLEQWVKGSLSNFNSRCSSVSVDKNNNVCVIGEYSTELQFDTIFLTTNNTTYGNTFIAKYNSNGNVLFAKNIADNQTSPNSGASVSTNSIGDIFTIGNFSDTAYFDSTYLSEGGVFITKYNEEGNFNWVKQVKNATNATDIFFDSNYDCIYTTGSLSASTFFDSIPIQVDSEYPSFIAKQKNLKNIIKGKVFLDINSDCNFNSGDYALKNIYVKAFPGPYYGITDVVGNYSIYTDTGGYMVKQVANGLPLFEQDCQLFYNVTLSHQFDTAIDINFANKVNVFCPKLWIDIGATNLRRCQNSQYFVYYCNNGTAPVSDAIIEIDFTNGINPISSSLPWSSVSGNVYTFDIGNLEIGQYGSFNVTVSVSCDHSFDNTEKCIVAIILPDTFCVQPDTAWDRRQLRIIGSCQESGFARFVIRNEHVLNITQSGIYKIFVNNTLAVFDTFILAQGDSTVYYYPANGNNIRFEIHSTSLDYYQSSAEVTIEGCGGTTPVLGMAGQLPENDYADYIEKDCKMIGPYDPNDKIVKPIGVTQMHYINENDELEYQINFQNTGNDTAFNVFLIDTISTFLDITSLVSGASSYTYTFNVSGANIAEWTFNNILLPDSNVNLEGSKGFVKYKIQQQPNNLPNTVINNNAAIYFDYNDAVITNTTSNIVYDTTLLCTEPMPVSDFMFMQNGFNFAFASTSTNADYFYWTFGDDSVSFEENPWHTFLNSGQYNVCLVASNNCFCDTFCQTIDVLITGIQNELSRDLKIYPNPAKENIIIESPQEAFVEISSTQGQIFKILVIKDKIIKVDISEFPSGVYIVKAITEKGIVIKKFIKT